MLPHHRVLPPHLVHTAIALPRWQRLAVWWACVAVWATGAAWLTAHWGWTGLGEEGLPLNTGAKLWSVRLHAAGVLALLLVLGGLAPVHIRLAWRARRNRASGVANLLVMALLLATGYLLWYANEGALRQGAEWTHWAVGIAVPLVLWLHQRLAKRRHRG